ncbi:hypothetical protein AJ78_02246 [Emergomyces pasteurianus Ep9510]|uniref:EKC/KEOPS complex subunit BUD32 n=1 Tax=Emergomyces pasteurianus Ep9510 TaxID=1447872 RepID=A0A1J9QNA5_9EURO|nr:hypothetical protein AJ78_02246 [Emergomyces pasteurianus Ep9510]
MLGNRSANNETTRRLKPLRQEWRGTLRQPCPPLSGDNTGWPAGLQVRITLGAAHGASRFNKAHRSLYLDENILHRDISENNIIITDPDKADGHSGMLIDLDLAKEVGSERSGARHQTGTMDFMARLGRTK